MDTHILTRSITHLSLSLSLSHTTQACNLESGLLCTYGNLCIVFTLCPLDPACFCKTLLAAEISLRTSSDSQRRSTMPMSKEEREMRKASREQQRAERAAESNTEQQRATESNREQQRAAESSREQQRAAEGSRGQQRAAEGSREQQRATQSNREQQRAAESSREQQDQHCRQGLDTSSQLYYFVNSGSTRAIEQTPRRVP